MYPYGLIGNGLCSALVSDRGSLDWLCLPRPDSPPVFGRLLDAQGGHFEVAAAGEAQSSQSYLPNTNVLETRFELKDGSRFRILDFCPRFPQFGRIYRPLSVFRIVEPLSGRPFLRVGIHPVNGWAREPMECSRGNSHLRFQRGADYLRLATNMSLTYLSEETAFGLSEPLYFALTWNAPLEDDLAAVSREFLRKTAHYWENWVKHCDIPVRHQKEAIRSALALKLHYYDDTGAILAALTTSLPEEPGGVRNWDYRFCWLRDAFFCLQAFHKLGHFEEMEGFLSYLLDLAHRDEARLRPVYRLDQGLPLPEEEQPLWEGFAQGRPVRSGNQAAEHVQNDVYGEMILTLTPLFLDDRFSGLRHPSHEKLVSQLAMRCMECLGKPDAGLWELRGGWRQHNFSQLMLWAGLDRAMGLKRKGLLRSTEIDVEKGLAQAEAALAQGAAGGVLGGVPGSDAADASLLLAPLLRFPDRRLCQATVNHIRAELKVGEGMEGFLYRYRLKDDFGKPGSAFMICSFWLVQALASLGRLEEARAAMNEALKACNHAGLMAEHFDPAGGRQLGNFPQAYSHVGLIHAAFAVSEGWEEVL